MLPLHETCSCQGSFPTHTHTSATVLHAIAVEDLLPGRNVPLCVEQRLIATCCEFWDPALKPNSFRMSWLPVTSNSEKARRWQHQGVPGRVPQNPKVWAFVHLRTRDRLKLVNGRSEGTETSLGALPSLPPSPILSASPPSLLVTSTPNPRGSTPSTLYWVSVWTQGL